MKKEDDEPARAKDPPVKSGCEPPVGIDIPDSELFQRAPAEDECAICCLTLPNICEDKSRSYQPCCGKFMCVGCMRPIWGDTNLCPFCRSDGDVDFVEKLEKRVSLGDATAMYNLGVEYDKGRCMRKDRTKAIELYHQAAEHGSTTAHAVLARIYREGGNGIDRSRQKSIQHEVAAAMGGHYLSRHNLGATDLKNGHIRRAMKHFLIAASDGFEQSLKTVKAGYMRGLVEKEEYANALRAYQSSLDAIKSKERDEGLRMLNFLEDTLKAATSSKSR